MKLMIVDDSSLFRKRVIESIGEMNASHSIIQASNVEEAISKFEKKKPDVIILDICLADQSGIEVLKYIKKTRSKTKVIMLTNYASVEFKRKCYNLKTDYFFDKSSEYFEMLKTLEIELFMKVA